jgi:CheY-like chemotaxis protein
MTTIATTPIVFVADDDVAVRESLKTLLQASGWRAETFASAQAFLARPPALVPSCLVLDVFLADCSGLDHPAGLMWARNGGTLCRPMRRYRQYLRPMDSPHSCRQSGTRAHHGITAPVPTRRLAYVPAERRAEGTRGAIADAFGHLPDGHVLPAE